MVLSFFLMSPMAVKSDDQIYEPKIFVDDTMQPKLMVVVRQGYLGLKDSGRVRSSVEQYCNFFVKFLDDAFYSCRRLHISWLM